MAQKKESWKTVADMEALPESTRAELIDGVIYDMAAPTIALQRLDKDEYTLVQPDISVICDKDKLSNGKRCIGAPDWVIEVVSPSSDTSDYKLKLFKYQAAGVREYWIIDPDAERISIFRFESDTFQILPFTATVKSGIYPDLEINFSGLEL